jgi:hypothetical protein
MNSARPELAEGCWLRQAQHERVLKLHLAGSIAAQLNCLYSASIVTALTMKFGIPQLHRPADNLAIKDF